jgi:DNA-binding CsgD family transcriptional regulator/tetratricopeptide (TPR) repeat protein
VVEVASPAFVGRAAELARLEAAYQRAAGGEPNTVIVGGEAGIGKSRLIEAFAERVRAAGVRVIVGSCLDLGEAGLPYAPLIEALRTLLRETEPGALPALLGPGRAELARLLPEIGSRVAASDTSVAAGVLPSRLSQARLFELVLGVLERLARAQPVVAVVEDLQWADRSTRDLLLFLERSVRKSRVLFVLTARTDEIDRRSPLLPFLAELERREEVKRMDLKPFAREELVAELTSIAGSPPSSEMVDSVLERSGGNPFFAEQLFVASREQRAGELPPQLKDVLLARVAELSNSAQDVLRIASAAGRRVDDRLLAAVLDIPARELDAALREVIDHQILVPVPVPGGEVSYAFHHALLQEVVYADLLPGERARLHAAFAEALSARIDDPRAGAPAPAELAYHWDAARDWPRAMPAMVEAGMAAERVYAFGDALRYYERALEIWDRLPATPDLRLDDVGDRVDLLKRAAECACLIGEYSHAVELGRAALAGIDPFKDSIRAGMLNERLRWFLWESGDRAGAAEALAEAERLVPADPPSAARARILGHLAGIDMFAGWYEESLSYAAASLEQARGVGSKADEAFAMGIMGWDIAMLGDVDGGIERFRSALGMAESIDGVEGLGLGYTSLAALLDVLGRTEESLEVAQEGLAKTRGLGLSGTYGALLLGSAAHALLALGRWDEADRATREGLEREPTGRPAVWLHVNRARLDTGRGAFEAAELHLRLARTVDDRLGGTEYRNALLAAQAELAVWQGRIDECRSTVSKGLAHMTEGPPEPALGWLAAVGLRAEADAAERARARRDAQAEAEARRRADDLADRLVRMSSGAAADDSDRQLPEGLQRALEALAALCGAELGRLEGTAGPDEWRVAADAWERLGRPFVAAYARYREGGAILAARGSRHDAESRLAAAHETARRLGAGPLLREVELLARQARLDLAPGDAATPDAAAASGSTTQTAEAAAIARIGFTPREAEVLRLVAGGWSNQQIADHLFISRKTASVHVSNILGKLGVDSRVEAAAIAHRLGLGADAPPPPDADTVI